MHFRIEVSPELVGGYIEIVPLFDTFQGEEAVACCNEEGKLDRLPVNTNATEAWWLAAGQPLDDFLVGDVVICQGDAEFMASL